MTQEDLAARTGIGVKLISAYENDKIKPRQENWLRLLEVLDGTWPATASDPDPPAPERSPLCTACELARVIASRDVNVIVYWREDSGDLDALGIEDGDRVVAIRTSVVPATLDDIRSLRACVDRLAQQIAETSGVRTCDPAAT
jgi:transcriptional regulator with XRE-family HTH domain